MIGRSAWRPFQKGACAQGGRWTILKESLSRLPIVFETGIHAIEKCASAR
jgi:hypothetical protein